MEDEKIERSHKNSSKMTEESRLNQKTIKILENVARE